ncbi:MAG: hypothetical protein H0T46_26370 [Deltaproteobacteria bacterium]|nr:hypothetical protein [Deltaproteobacteria bacterium]
MIVPAVLCAAVPVARADEPITNTDYAIEFYDGVAIGNTQQVGMGGAGAALIVGTSGGLLNPSAPAVRLTTDTDTWSWDYHLDVLTGTYSSDYDNNGQREPGGASLVTLGLGGRYRDWAAAVTFTGQTSPVEVDTSTMPALDAEALRVRFMVGRYFASKDFALGIGAQTVSFQITPQGQESLFEVTGGGLIAGVTWLPKYRSFRAAAAWESPILGADVSSTCDPMSCAGFILPERVASPWRVIAGGAFRFAETEWNQLVGGIFRDEPSLTLAADIVIAGPSQDAYGIEAFGKHMLQRAGSHTAFSFRAGAEYEWLPGRLRWRAGAYWEPERYEGVGGRVHVTFGVELRVFELQLWGRRRGRLSFTGDLAARYRNVAVSVGFWH